MLHVRLKRDEWISVYAVVSFVSALIMKFVSNVWLCSSVSARFGAAWILKFVRAWEPILGLKSCCACRKNWSLEVAA